MNLRRQDSGRTRASKCAERGQKRYSTHTYICIVRSKLLNFTPSRVSYHQIKGNDSYSIFNFHQFIYLLACLPTHLYTSPSLASLRRSPQNSMVKSALKNGTKAQREHRSPFFLRPSYNSKVLWFSKRNRDYRNSYVNKKIKMKPKACL